MCCLCCHARACQAPGFRLLRRSRVKVVKAVLQCKGHWHVSIARKVMNKFQTFVQSCSTRSRKVGLNLLLSFDQTAYSCYSVCTFSPNSNGRAEPTALTTFSEVGEMQNFQVINNPLLLLASPQDRTVHCIWKQGSVQRRDPIPPLLIIFPWPCCALQLENTRI